MQESRDKIKNRMIRNASRIWGYPDTQPESSFDPLVSMLLGACANELEKISKEINNTESRLVEKLVQILTPDPIVSPSPAHALLHAMPSRPVMKISPDYQFYTTKKLASISGHKTVQKQVFFSPAGDYSLLDAEVRYLAFGHAIYEFFENEYKDPVVESRTPLSPTSIWLGIKVNPGIKSGEKLPLYFDIRSQFLREDFLGQIHNAHWFINGKKIQTAKGLERSVEKSQAIDDWLDKNINLTSKVVDKVNNYYQEYFHTLELNVSGDGKKGEPVEVPDVISQAFPEKELDRLEKDLVWVEVRFMKPVEKELIDDFYCFTNTFPIINRRLYEFTVSARNSLNIIPLSSEEMYFDLKSVSNRDGHVYRVQQFSGLNELDNGSLLVRHGGVNRFDTSNAKEYLEYLLELLKDESASFNVLGSEMMSSDLRELSQVIARLEKKLSETKVTKKDSTYLILKTKKKDDQVFIEFWSTDGPFANDMKKGTRLMIYQGKDLHYDSLKMLSNTVGGKDKPGTEERINLYRRALLSRNRLVTHEDIKALCYEHFSDIIRDIELKKGMMKGSGVKNGFIATMDIHLKLLKKDLKDEIEIDNRVRDLKVDLENQSTNILPFRVFLE
jgi:hypothetical protein